MTQSHHHSGLRIKVDDKLFLKNPDSSEMGQKIIEHSILLIDRIGFEAFTFRKLAEEIHSTEATIYRYFENKHKLLLFLLSWYWQWMDYRIVFATHNVSIPEQRLETAIRLLTEEIEEDPEFAHVDERALYRIVVAESSKVYLIKNVDEINREGHFASYKRLCRRVADIVREINPDYQYPTALISTVVESSHDQKFFGEHLPSLTEVRRGHSATEFLTHLVFSAISRK